LVTFGNGNQKLMLDQSAAATARRITAARLHGTAMRYARWEEPTPDDTAEAVAALLEVLAGRDDGPALLAEVAGVLIGFHDGRTGEFQARVAAHFLIEAGADESLADEWIAEGKRRAEVAGQLPFGLKVLGLDRQRGRGAWPEPPGDPGRRSSWAGRLRGHFQAVAARQHCRPKTGAGHPTLLLRLP
jgi:hypothetical protein